jgi:hypothetical protein
MSMVIVELRLPCQAAMRLILLMVLVSYNYMGESPYKISEAVVLIEGGRLPDPRAKHKLSRVFYFVLRQ